MRPANSFGITHATTSYFLRDIASLGVIEPQEKCKVLGEHVVYTFYGRAAFRGSSSFQPTSLASLFPTVLVLDPHQLPKPRYVFPFDTGAFNDGLMDAHLHPQMPLFDFLLTPEVSQAARLISAIFGNSKAYFRNGPPKNFAVPPSNFEADSYKKIIFASCSAHSGGLDERASTPEIVFDRLQVEKCVVAAVMPDTLADDAAIGDLLKAKGVEIHQYPWTSGSRPNEYHFVVQNLVKDIQASRGWL